MIQRISPRERFERFVYPDPNSGCWLWGGGSVAGYGMFWWGGDPNSMRAHRASWLLYRGSIPDDLCVLHRCDFPTCVNPEHLFLGTGDDNMADRAAKGRTALCGAKGDANGTHTKPHAVHRGTQIVQAKLNENSVRAIRRDHRRLRLIAKDYGVCESAISNIKNLKRWRHVD